MSPAARARPERDAVVEATLRFNHPARNPDLMRLHITEDDVRPFVARELGMTVEDLDMRHGALLAACSSAAEEVFARPGIAGLCRLLPFASGDVVVALGDSVTDDLLSWANQLERLLELAVPERAITVVNAGHSGDTTADVIDRLDLVLQERPTWVVQLLGTNDARRHGLAQHPVFTAADTGRNLDTIAGILRAGSAARLIRMTPPPVLPRRIERWDPFVTQRITWRPDDIRRIAALLPADATTIDLHTSMSVDADALIGEDGLHPNLLGQQFILERLVRALAG